MGLLLFLVLFVRDRDKSVEWILVIGPIDIRSETDPGREEMAAVLATRYETVKAICEGSAEKLDELSPHSKLAEKLWGPKIDA